MSGSTRIIESAAKSIGQTQPKDRSVLIVESDPDSQWQLARMLTVDGNRVVGTGSGEGAITVMEQWPVDLVLIAENLPRMSGLELARRLRAHNPALRVILMAEEGEEQLEERIPSSDITALLAKPFRFEALRSLMDSLRLAPTPAE